MQVEIRHRPAFATLFDTLAAGETILAEAAAMASMSTNVVLRPSFWGGFWRALLRRVFGGESLFVNAFECQSGQGQVVLTQPTPGDIQCVELHGNALFLQPGAFIACGAGVLLRLGWAGFASWFGGEGLFRVQVSGHGPVWFGAYGGVFAQDIHGEQIVDTGHLIAYEPTLSLHIGLPAGIVSSILGGEGFITRVRGQGRIYLQSRSIESLAAWTNAHL